MCYELDISEGMPSVNEVLDAIHIPDEVYAALDRYTGVGCGLHEKQLAYAFVSGWWLGVRASLVILEAVGFDDPECGPSYELVEVGGVERAAVLGHVRGVLLDGA